MTRRSREAAQGGFEARQARGASSRGDGGDRLALGVGSSAAALAAASAARASRSGSFSPRKQQRGAMTLSSGGSLRF